MDNDFRVKRVKSLEGRLTISKQNLKDLINYGLGIFQHKDKNSTLKCNSFFKSNNKHHVSLILESNNCFVEKMALIDARLYIILYKDNFINFV